jgi:hypothetical protein
LVNHGLHINDAEDIVTVDKKEIAEMIAAGKECEKDGCRCRFFDEEDGVNLGPKEHKEITRTIGATLRRIFKAAKQDIVDISISW